MLNELLMSDDLFEIHKSFLHYCRRQARIRQDHTTADQITKELRSLLEQKLGYFR
ncbi:hypothetical protein [Paenibacillus lautus]|uniref:hypothetical protein n=1 Tax=Paenibacillus lautus TaxID=1401 RepID=UPI0013C4B9FD|nr:hypothetical protein [Paenibacillus lautus]